MPIDNRCMYMAHVCFYVCCSDCVGVYGNVCYVAAVVKNSVFFSLGVLQYVVCLCRGYRNNLLNKNSTKKKNKQNYYKNKINYNIHYLHLS